MTSIERKALAAAAIAVVLPALMVGCGRNAVAKVNGVKITQAEYYSRLEHLPTSIAGRNMESGALVLRQMVNEQIILDLAKRDGVTPSQREINDKYAEYGKTAGFTKRLRESGITTDQLKAAIKVDLSTFKLQTKGVTVPDAEVKGFYDKNKDTVFKVPEIATVAAIIVRSKSAGQEAMQMLDEKKLPFSTVARQYSIAPQSDQKSVQIARGSGSPPELQDAIFSTPIGRHTKPIAGRSGTFGIFQVLTHNAASITPFEKVKPKIWEKLMLDQGRLKNDLNTEMAKKVEEYTKGHKISIDIKRYKDIMKTQPMTPGAQ